MKTKKLLAMLLLALMMFATVGTMAGCAGKDGGDDKQVETQDKDDDQKDTEIEPEATATPEPTATPTPEVLPTAEELFGANEDMFDGKMKMSTKFAYKLPTEYGEVAMTMDAEILNYENITYESSKSTISLMDTTENMSSEIYYVDDEDSAIRTEYSFDSENEVWVKSQYAYVALDEDEEAFPFEAMKDVEVSQDGAFYCVTGVLDDAESMGDAESFGMEGMEMGTMSCTFKFDKETKKIVVAEIDYKFDMEGLGEETISVDGLSVVIEGLEEPIVIPEEALAAELSEDLW